VHLKRYRFIFINVYNLDNLKTIEVGKMGCQTKEAKKHQAEFFFETKEWMGNRQFLIF